jgi:hypothetical protein
MSAKHKKGGNKPGSKPATPASAPQPTSAPISSAPVAASASASMADAGAGAAIASEPHVAWMDSSDPRKRMIGKIVFVGVWIYVAALWLLALDQTFHWGIFGPKVPPVP